MNKTIHISAEEYRTMVNNSECGMRNSELMRNTEFDSIQRLTNRVSNDRGRAFENLIVKGCQYYSLHERAVINKVYEPYRCVKKLDGGKFIGQFTARAEPDFKGVLAGGRAIVFEAKSTQKSRIQQNVLTTEQCAWLEEQQKMGALSFVCIEIQGQFFMLPWEIWRDMRKIYGKKFIMPGDIPEYEVIYDGAVRFLEYTDGGLIYDG